MTGGPEFAPGENLVPAASASSYGPRIDYERVIRVGLKAFVVLWAGKAARAWRTGIKGVEVCIA